MNRWLWPLVLFCGCDSLSQINPQNCVRNPDACSRDEFCNTTTQLCETLNCSINTSLCAPSEFCDPGSNRCASKSCVMEPALCTPTQDCNPLTKLCETHTFVLGQPDSQSNLNLAFGMSSPRGVLLVPDPVVAGKSRLLVADSSNQRVLIWNDVPTQNRPADAVLGMPDVHTQGAFGPFDGVNERSLSSPWSIASDGKNVTVGDQLLNRLLTWNQIPSALSTSGPIPANQFWGQPDFNSSLTDGGQLGVNGLGLSQPRLSVRAGIGFFIADFQNNRVLVFGNAPSSASDVPDFVIGQNNFTSNAAVTSATGLRGPRGVFCDGTELFVTDTLNHRVLSYALPISANAPAPATVFGQANLTAGASNRGGAPSADTLFNPNAVLVLGGAARTVFVADQGNHRVLRYTLPSTTADLVLGQANFSANQLNRGGTANASNMAFPIDVSSDGTRLAVADPTNNRVLIWNSLPTQNGQDADVALGQPSLTSAGANTPPTQSGLQFRAPGYVFTDGTRLLVADSGDNRVLIWNALPRDSVTPPDVVLGQPDLSSRFANAGLSAPTAATLFGPQGITIENGRLLIADTGNNRVLIWNQIPTRNFAPADSVIGQLNLTTGTVQPASRGLNQPFDVRLLQGRLYVADPAYNRVLVFNDPFAVGATANVVLGQPDINTTSVNTGGQSASTMSSPRAVLLDNGKLLVADRNNHRVLLWNSVPSANGTPADVVVGQIDFVNSFTRNDRTRLNFPNGVLVKDGRLYVTAGAQNRVLFWNQIPTENGQRADGVLGQGDFVSALPNNPDVLPIEKLSNPLGMAFAADQLFIADAQNNRVVVRGLP